MLRKRVREHEARHGCGGNNPSNVARGGHKKLQGRSVAGVCCAGIAALVVYGCSGKVRVGAMEKLVQGSNDQVASGCYKMCVSLEDVA